MSFGNAVGSDTNRWTREQEVGPPVARQLSMNMDELLRNIWTADEIPVAAGNDSGGACGLMRQGSLSLSRTLSQKTVDEVWQDLMKDGGSAALMGSEIGTASPGVDFQNQTQRRPTLGEMTLEDFLVRAGVVREEIIQVPVNATPIRSSITSVDARGPAEIELGFPKVGISDEGVMRNPIGNRQENLEGFQDLDFSDGLLQRVACLPAAAAASPVNQIVSDGLAKNDGEFSSASQDSFVFDQQVFRGGKSSMSGKVVERRQRRVVKNRESAARSRARKQAALLEIQKRQIGNFAEEY